jgi:3',5'-cyclic AMP phosphodiesterase CpdA
MRFLHCSDVHITQNYFGGPILPLGWRRWIALLELGPGGRSAAYAQAEKSLAQIVREMETHRADHLIVSGDLTAYAMESEFKGAHSALSAVVSDKTRLTVIPGNHDTYTPGAMRERRFEKYFGHLLDSDMPEYAREGPYPFVRLLGEEAAVIGLCSARMPLVPGLSYGTIGSQQLSALREITADKRLAHRAVLVVVHHAPLTRRGRRDKPLHGLTDADELFQILRGDKYAVLHGHIHDRYHHPASATRPHTFGAGSSTEAGHEGYWVIEVADGRVLGGTMQKL